MFIGWRGPSMMRGETIDVGGEADYIAVYTCGALSQRFAKGQPLGHAGLVVDDLGADKAVVKQAVVKQAVVKEAAVKSAGLHPFNHADYAPGRRFYFFDRDGTKFGFKFEMVSYN